MNANKACAAGDPGALDAGAEALPLTMPRVRDEKKLFAPLVNALGLKEP